MTRTCHLDATLYPQSCVAVAQHEFTGLCSVVSAARDDGVQLTISPRDGAPAETVDEFLNFVLCAALEQHLTR